MSCHIFQFLVLVSGTGILCPFLWQEALGDDDALKVRLAESFS